MGISQSLLIEVYPIAGHYHGVGDWPPSPFRLFQALVAGAYGGRWIAEDRQRKDAAFKWLERQPAPLISVPSRVEGGAFSFFVPNNDLDGVGGNPARAAEIRVGKASRASLLESGAPFLYLWPVDIASEAEVICQLSERLHTLGRGIDAAFARAALMDSDAALARLDAQGRVRRPCGTGGDLGLRCPVRGSFLSLVQRHARQSNKLERRTDAPGTLFRQPPKAKCTVVQYDQPPVALLFDIRKAKRPDNVVAIPQTRAVAVVIAIRDLAVHRLSAVKPGRAAEFEHIIAGRGERPPAVSQRPRIVPLPSIGGAETNRSIRRVLIEMPSNCPISVADVDWAVTGQAVAVSESSTGEVVEEIVLVRASDEGMLKHYGADGRRDSRARTWRTVTPIALPPPRLSARSGAERANVERVLAASVADAARHAGLPHRTLDVLVQREPFHKRGAIAGSFAAARFNAGDLHHAEITFPKAIAGPLVIGNGRWLGLGVMAPVSGAAPDVHCFRIAGGDWTMEDSTAIARAVRRAVMARAGASLKPGRHLPAFFSGHEADGTPARRDSHAHLFYLVDDADGDGRLDLIAITSPKRCDRCAPESPDQLALLQEAVDGLSEVRAGRTGIIRLAPLPIQHQRLFASSRIWESSTLYVPTRYPRSGADPIPALSEDVLLECSRRGFRQPVVTILDVVQGRRGATRCRARLGFDVAIPGPIALGRDSHFGQGIFVPAGGAGMRAK